MSTESPRWIIDQKLTQDPETVPGQYYVYNEESQESFLVSGYGSGDNPIMANHMSAGSVITEVIDPAVDLARNRQDNVFLLWGKEFYVITQAGSYFQVKLDERQQEYWDWYTEQIKAEGL